MENQIPCPPHEYKPDCRYMQWDRPCIYHKKHGVHCEECSYYQPQGHLIVLVKLGALGDVLRTTAILKPLKARYPVSKIVWVTLPQACSVLEHIPEIDMIIPLGSPRMEYLWCVSFDLLLNPDPGLESAALAGRIVAREKLGYVLNQAGQVCPCNDEAREWLLMGLFDDCKKANTITYQEHICRIFRLPAREYGPTIVNLTPEERLYGASWIEQCGASEHGIPLVGIATGAGKRWPKKSWGIHNYEMLIRRILSDISCQVVLLGGEAERENHSYLTSIFKDDIIDAGNHHSLRGYFGIMERCSTVVTGDTLALHAALGLGKKVVVLLGPTSSAELDLYGSGRKIVSPKECVCCYKTACDIEPSCMDEISVDSVFNAVKEMVGGCG